MCLERVDKVYKPMKDTAGTGWKVLERVLQISHSTGENVIGLQFPYSLQKITFGKWMKRQWRPSQEWDAPEYYRVMHDEHGVSYPVGFHVFTDYDEALDYRGNSKFYEVVEVEWRGLLAEGYQYMQYGDNKSKHKRTNCVITREIKFHE